MSESDANEKPAKIEAANQSDSSEISVHSQHSNSVSCFIVLSLILNLPSHHIICTRLSFLTEVKVMLILFFPFLQSNNQTWNLASFIKPVQAVTNENSMNGRSNRESAPYDPVGDEGPFGSVQSILSSLSSTGDDDGQKLDPISPIPTIIEPLSCDKERMNEMVANIAGQVNSMPSSYLLSPVPTPCHSSYADDQKPFTESFIPAPRQKLLARPENTSLDSKSQIKTEPQKSKIKDDDKCKLNDDFNKTMKLKKFRKISESEHCDRICEKSPKLNTPKIDRWRNTPSRTNSSANKRKKRHQTEIKSTEFLSEESNSFPCSDDENNDNDVLNSSVKGAKYGHHVGSSPSSSKLNEGKPKSATQLLPRFNKAKDKIEAYANFTSPVRKSSALTGFKSENISQKVPKIEPLVKNLINEPLSPINSNLNQHSRSTIPGEKPRHVRSQIMVQLDLALIDRIPGQNWSNVLNHEKDVEITDDQEKENQDNSFAFVESVNNASKLKSEKKGGIQSKDDSSQVSQKSSSSSKSKSHKRKQQVHDTKKDKKRHRTTTSSLGSDVSSKQE